MYQMSRNSLMLKESLSPLGPGFFLEARVNVLPGSRDLENVASEMVFQKLAIKGLDKIY